MINMLKNPSSSPAVSRTNRLNSHRERWEQKKPPSSIFSHVACLAPCQCGPTIRMFSNRCSSSTDYCRRRMRGKRTCNNCSCNCVVVRGGEPTLLQGRGERSRDQIKNSGRISHINQLQEKRHDHHDFSITVISSFGKTKGSQCWSSFGLLRSNNVIIWFGSTQITDWQTTA